MKNLDRLGAASLRHQRARSILTSVGVVLGVAVLFGVLTASASVNRGLHDEIRSFTGQADADISAVGDGAATLSATTVARIQSLPGVAQTTSRLQVDATDNGNNQPLVGIDPQAGSVADLYLSKGQPPRPGSNDIVIGVEPGTTPPAIGSAIPLVVNARPVVFRVSGLVDAARADRFGGINVDLIALTTAQRLNGEGAVVGDLGVVLNHGVNRATWIATYRYAIPGVRVINANMVGSGFASFLTIIQSALAIFAFLALFVGAFLIYLTLSVAVVERTAVYGTLRALGATPRQVLRTVVVEALTLGAVATVVGLLFGFVLSFGLLHLFGSALQLDKTPALVITPIALIASVLLGMLVTLGASVIPARQASRLSPTVAMRGNIEARAKLSRAWIAGVVLLVVGFALSLTGSTTAAAPSTVLMLLGGVLIVPPLLSPLARLLGRATSKLGRGVGDIIVMHLVKERSRSANTLALVMVILAMAFSVGAIQASNTAALNRVVNREYGADIDIFSPGQMTPSQLAIAQSVPGMGPTSPLRFGVSSVVTSKSVTAVDLNIIEAQTFFRVEGFAWLHGDDSSARAALTRGGGIIVPGVIADDNNWHVGSPIVLLTDAGPHTFNVAGIYASFGGSTADLVVGVGDGARFFGSHAPEGMVADVTSGASPAVVAAAARVALHAGSDDTYQKSFLNVVDAATVKADARAKLARYFTIFYAILLIAIITGLLGLANTLAISVVQRFREIGLLRAVGAQRRQIVASVMVEAATLVSVAFVLALPLGFLSSIGLVPGISRGLGFDVPYKFPVGAIPLLAILAAVVGLVAALAPARRAGRMTVVESLRFD